MNEDQDQDQGELEGLPSQPDGTSLKTWRHRASAARKLREDWEREYRVEECERFYLGKQSRGQRPNDDAINHFLATVRVTIPNLLFDQPVYLAKPKPGGSSPVTDIEARASEGVLNSIATQDDNLRSASRLGLLQNFFRIAVIKVCYDPYLEPNPRAGQPILQQDAQGNIVYDPQTGEPQPELDPQTGQPILEPDQVMCDEAYRFEWVDSRNMLLPNAGPDMSKWPWVMEEVEVDLEEAKADPRFPAELRVKFTASAKWDGDTKPKRPSEDNQDKDEYFHYVEVWDIRKKRHLIFTTDDLDDFLLDEPMPDGIEDHPYSIMPGWFPNLGPKPSPWPLPYTCPWLGLQREYNISRAQQTEGGKRSARKVFYEKGMFDDADEAVKALQSSKDMEAVMVSDINRVPKVQVDPDVPQAIYKSSGSILSDWRIVTGQTGAKVGLPDADTATEATFVQQASNLRDADLQKEVTNWLKVAGKKMLQLVRQTLTLKVWVNIKGLNDKELGAYLQSIYGIPPEAALGFPGLKSALVQRFGANRIQGITREDLQGEVAIEVVPGSTRPYNLSTVRSQLLEFAGLVANAPQLALSRELLSAIARTFDQVPEAVVEELHALAQQMIMLSQSQAGRTAGKGGAQENIDNSSIAQQNGVMGQVAQGNEMM